jgi:hypothetical protein
MRYKRKVIISILVLVIGLLFSGLGVFLLLKAFEPLFYDLSQLCIGVVMLGLGGYSLLYSYREGDFEISNRQLILYNVFGRVRRRIEEHEIICSAIVEHKDEMFSSKELVLRLSSGERLSVYSFGLRKFYGYPQLLRRKNKESRRFQAVMNYRKETIQLKALSIIGLMFLILGLLVFQGKELLNRSDLVEVSGVVESVKVKRKKGRVTLWVWLQDFEDHKFHLARWAFSKTEKEALVLKLKKGALVDFQITQREYEAKLEHKPPADFSFWEKHVNYRRIDVFELIMEDKAFGSLDLKNEKTIARNEGLFGYLLVLIGGVFLAFIWSNWPSRP